MATGTETATRTVAWAATSTWRGDLKLFARIAEKAVEEVTQEGQPANCKIEFAIRDDSETYDSVSKLLEWVPASTVRSFSSARIIVGGAGLEVAICFGRKKPHDRAAFACDLGVAIRVSSDGAVDEETIARIRTGMAKLIARGGFPWGAHPSEGPTDENPDLDAALSKRWRERQGWSQAIFLAVALAVIGLAYAVYTLVELDAKDKPDGLLEPGNPIATVIVVSVVQVASFFLSNLIFPAIQIADVTPGRRILQVVGRSGVLTAAVGIAGAYFKSKFG
ncbi:MAG TPA: hypothetical protein VF081_04190 [Solirubrobacterales bacterium]